MREINETAIMTIPNEEIYSCFMHIKKILTTNKYGKETLIRVIE